MLIFYFGFYLCGKILFFINLLEICWYAVCYCISQGINLTRADIDTLWCTKICASRLLRMSKEVKIKCWRLTQYMLTLIDIAMLQNITWLNMHTDFLVLESLTRIHAGLQCRALINEEIRLSDSRSAMKTRKSPRMSPVSRIIVSTLISIEASESIARNPPGLFCTFISR